MGLRGKVRTSVDVPWRNLAKLDLIWAVVAPTLALWLRDDRLFDHEHLRDTLSYIGISSVVTAASFLCFRLSQRVSRFFSVDDALTVFWASAVAVISTLLVCFMLTRLENIPRSVPVLHFLLLATGNVAARMFRYTRRRRRDRPYVPTTGVENLVVVGVSDLSWYYMEIVDHLMSDLYNIVAVLDERTNLQGRYVHGYPVAGRVRDIEAVLGEYGVHGVPIHRLVLSMEPAALAPETLEQLFRAAEKRGIEVDVLPERLGLGRKSGSLASAMPPVTSNAVEYARDPTFWRLKRAVDVAVSATILLVTAPLTLVICLFVLFDCGLPVLFWQVRVGRHGRKIAVYKFRTLKAPYRRDGEPVAEKQRISWVGRLLRRTHLDELPQVLSVLRGDMSLIGPRPLLPIDLAEKMGLRLTVRPGITGWAQINGATLVTPDEKNAMDEWYIRHASWRLELAIAAGTPRTLFASVQRNEDAIAEALREQGALEHSLQPGSDKPAQATSQSLSRLPKIVHADDDSSITNGQVEPRRFGGLAAKRRVYKT